MFSGTTFASAEYADVENRQIKLCEKARLINLRGDKYLRARSKDGHYYRTRVVKVDLLGR